MYKTRHPYIQTPLNNMSMVNKADKAIAHCYCRFIPAKGWEVLELFSTYPCITRPFNFRRLNFQFF